ncbi:MAG: peptide-methionine (S)-S-oxide reductase [Myxococcales bacterium]|nr:peptide-methionine (S)-S-oxide reductase [Myxococcales bacterium]
MRLVLATLMLSCSLPSEAASPSAENRPAPVPAAGVGQAVAVFAGGCFWCMETDFDHLDGVVHTTSGFAGGHTVNPTYMDVVSEKTGHQEAVHVVYDTAKLSYGQVVDYFIHHVDPTDDGGQFCDRGDSYRAVIFAQTPEQKRVADAAIAALEEKRVLPGPVKVPVKAGTTFYAAEVYHQDFHDKSPGRYLPYRMGCGRDLRVREVWRNE